MNTNSDMFHKNKVSVGQQGPITDETLDETYTQEPVHVVESEEPLIHRHFGHPKEHPIALRHRKHSADPLHGDEDKLVDEYKDLWDKAKKGNCSANEMHRIRDIKGKLQEIHSQRESDARNILGSLLDISQVNETVHLRKSLDAAYMVSGSLIKGGGELDYPVDQDDEEVDGTSGSMKTPTMGRAVHKERIADDPDPFSSAGIATKD